MLFWTTVRNDVLFSHNLLTIEIRFEAGTPAIGEAIGLGAAIDYLSGIGMQNVHDYEVYYEMSLILRERISLGFDNLAHVYLRI